MFKKLWKVVDKYRRSPVQAKAAIWYTICNILQKGIAFLVVPIYVRFLTTYEFGQYSVFQSWRDIIVIFATLNLYCGVFTKALVDYKYDRDRYTSCMQVLSTIITIVIFAIYCLQPIYWNKLLDMDATTIFFMFGYFITFPAFQFWSVRQRVENKYKTMVVVTLLVAIITPVFSLLLLFYTNLRENAVIWGFLIVQIAFGVYFYFCNLFYGRCLYDKNYWEHALRFNIPLIPHYLSLIALAQIDRVMIKEFCGAAQAGIYSLAYSISQLMNVFVVGINSAFVPWIYENIRSRQFDSLQRVTNLLCLLVGSITFFSMMISPEIVSVMGTEEYMQAIWIIPAVSLSAYLAYCYGLFVNIEFYYNATKFVMFASTIGALVKVCLNYIFIPQYGFLSAGYTTLVSYFVLLIMHYFFSRNISIKCANTDEIFDNNFIWRSCLILFLAMCLCVGLYKINILRITLVFIIGIVLMMKRQKIFRMVKEIKSR